MAFCPIFDVPLNHLQFNSFPKVEIEEIIKPQIDMLGFIELNDRKYFILTTTNCHILHKTYFFIKLRKALIFIKKKKNTNLKITILLMRNSDLKI